MTNAFPLPASLKPRCMRVYGWDEETIDKALAGYNQFMTLKLRNEDWEGNDLVASATVLAVWKEHALDRENYDKACNDYCGGGNIIILDPENELFGVNPNKDLATRINMTRISLKSAFGKRNVDVIVWSFDGVTTQDTKDTGQKVDASPPAAASSKGGSGAPVTVAVSSYDPDQAARSDSNQSSGATTSENLEGGGNKNREKEDEVVKNKINGAAVRKNVEKGNGDLENDIDISKSDEKEKHTTSNKRTGSQKEPEKQGDKSAGENDNIKTCNAASLDQGAKNKDDSKKSAARTALAKMSRSSFSDSEDPLLKFYSDTDSDSEDGLQKSCTTNRKLGFGAIFADSRKVVVKAEKKRPMTSAASQKAVVKTEKKTPAELDTSRDVLSIRVRDTEGEKNFMLRNSTNMRKVFRKFCSLRDRSDGSYTFWFDGDKINSKKCVRDLGIEDNDLTDAIPVGV